MSSRRRHCLLLPFLAATLCVCACIILPGCDIKKNATLAEAAADDFHLKFNLGRFRDIYTAAHPDFKSSMSEADFIKLCEAMQRKLGQFRSATHGAWRISGHGADTRVAVTLDSVFEKGKGTETFTFRIDGPACTMKEYHINSLDLMVK